MKSYLKYKKEQVQKMHKNLKRETTKKKQKKNASVYTNCQSVH